MKCPDGTFGLNACRGPVRLVRSTRLCAWHHKKRAVFGAPMPHRPDDARPLVPECPTCGHAWIPRRVA